MYTDRLKRRVLVQLGAVLLPSVPSGQSCMLTYSSANYLGPDLTLMRLRPESKLAKSKKQPLASEDDATPSIKLATLQIHFKPQRLCLYITLAATARLTKSYVIA